MERDDDLREGIEQLEQGRHAIALEHFTLAADDAATAQDRLAAVAHATQTALTLQRPYEAIAWAERLRVDSSTTDEANLLEAAAWVALGDGAQALVLLEGVSVPATAATAYPPSLVHQLRCQAHGFVGDVDEALTEAFTALLADWELPEIWRALAVVAAEHDVDLTEAVARIPDEGLMHVLGWLLESPAGGTDCIVESLWQRWPGDRRILALMTSVANRLTLERALEWSARLRSAGLTEDCAVLGIAATEDRPARERVCAAAVAASAFGDDRAVPLLEVATVALSDDELSAAFEELLEVAPDDLFDVFVVASATTARRAMVLAGLLLSRGATDPALALARHAVAATTGQPEALRDALTESLPADAAAHLVRELTRRGDVEAGAMLAAVAR